MKTRASLLALGLGLLVIPLTASISKPKSVAPEVAIERLQNGNARYAAGNTVAPRRDPSRLKESAKGQYPFASILTCADSRVSPELMFDQGVGDLFVVRTAGNTASPETIGSLEFGAAVLGSKLLVVMGHDKCGAVDAAIKGGDLPGSLPAVIAPIQPAVQNAKGQGLQATMVENVRVTVQKIRETSTILSDMEKKGELQIVGAHYDLASGKVKMFRVN